MVDTNLSIAGSLSIVNRTDCHFEFNLAFWGLNTQLIHMVILFFTNITEFRDNIWINKNNNSNINDLRYFSM